MNEAREDLGLDAGRGDVPRLLYAQDIAALLGWGTDRMGVQRARRWMKRNGMQDRDGKRFVTTRTRLREAFPAAYLDAIDDLS